MFEPTKYSALCKGDSIEAVYSAVSNAISKFTIPRNGDFFVRIFGASYDRTGGTWLGATLTLESEFEVVGSCSATGVTQQNANPPTPWPTPPPTNAAHPDASAHQRS